MTRKQIESLYTVIDGIITNPGKFEGEAVYVPYFWALTLDGAYDGELHHLDGGPAVVFDVTDEDRAEFPELANVRKVYILETDSGFVVSHVE